jgi:hypothetical protein
MKESLATARGRPIAIAGARPATLMVSVRTALTTSAEPSRGNVVGADRVGGARGAAGGALRAVWRLGLSWGIGTNLKYTRSHEEPLVQPWRKLTNPQAIDIVASDATVRCRGDSFYSGSTFTIDDMSVDVQPGDEIRRLLPNGRSIGREVERRRAVTPRTSK